MTDEDSRARQSLDKEEGNGSEKWHDALRKHAELERRVAELEQRLEVVEKRLRATPYVIGHGY